MPANMEEPKSAPKRWQCGDPYQYPIEGDPDPWKKLLDPALEVEGARCAIWKDEVQNLLVFSGLFSAVVTAFVIESYTGLQPEQDQIMVNLLAHIAARLDDMSNTSSIPPVDPAALAGAIPASSIRINVFWFISLVLSLTTALIGIVSLQWLREYQNYSNSLSSAEQFAMLNMRREGLEAWYVPRIFAALPVLLQLALVLFFVGLVDFLFVSSWKVAIPVVVIVATPFIFLFITTISPAWQTLIFALPVFGQVPQQVPYKSPQSELFRYLLGCSSSLVKLCVRAIGSFVRRSPHDFQHQGAMSDSSVRPLHPDLNRFIRNTLAEQSWSAYDKTWCIVRNDYAYRIFQGQGQLQLTHDRDDSGYYDNVQGIDWTLLRSPNVWSDFDRSNSDSRMCYLACKDIIENTIRFELLHYRYAYSHTRTFYLQNLFLLSRGDNITRRETLSSILGNPPLGFLRDESNLICLSEFILPGGMSHPHFQELHLRIANHLFGGKADNRIWDPVERPQWTDLWPFAFLTWRLYPDSDGVIREQSSLFLKGFLEKITDKRLDLPVFLRQLASELVHDYIFSAVKLLTPETELLTSALLSKCIKRHIEEGQPSDNSDFVFYMASRYAKELLRERSWDMRSTKNHNDSIPKEDRISELLNLVDILRAYLRGRGEPNADIREALGLAEFSKPWWNFLLSGEDRKMLSQGRLNKSLAVPVPIQSNESLNVGVDIRETVTMEMLAQRLLNEIFAAPMSIQSNVSLDVGVEGIQSSDIRRLLDEIFAAPMSIQSNESLDVGDEDNQSSDIRDTATIEVENMV